MKRNKWSQADRQRYADGDRLRASKRPGKRRDEWVPLPTEERIEWAQGVDHTWDNCYCGCDPDWHYLDAGPWAPMLHCGNCKEQES